MTEKQQKLAQWHQLKYHLDSERDRVPLVKEQEVWWCALGENIGVEINGKSHWFSRPVLILKKLSHRSFIIIPFTSQNKKGNWYTHFRFLGKNQVAVLSQERVISVERLYTKIGTIDDNDYQKIKDDFKKLLSL
ncbi:type II toxin-antitoxin system PemK/MazF family toxin [bacterium]|nr:type II toxin-antitoxin system PemK/MazF family toxin [bacterium]